jgi:dienelactone hydrolase
MPSALRLDRDRRRQSRYGLPVAPIIAIVAGLLLSGCATHVHTPYVPGSAPGMFHPIAATGMEFDYLAYRDPIEVLEDFAADAGDYWVSSLQMPSSGTAANGHVPVTARYYQGKLAGAKPLVIVLPVWGISSYPSKTIADSLRARSGGGINILQVDGEHMLFDWAAIGDARSEAEFHHLLDLTVQRFADMVIDVRRLVDWAETRPEVDTGRIALIGFSMSAIVGSIVLTNEPRIDVGVLVVGGADLHEILAACNGRMQRTRERIVERFGWSIEQFKEELKAPLAAINPVRFAGRLDPDRVLIIEAGQDSCIPESARERFWLAMGRPERISYQYDHRMTFLAMTFLGGNDLQYQIHQFLDRTLAPREVRYEAAQVDLAPH